MTGESRTSFRLDPSSDGRVDTPGIRPHVTIGDFSRASQLSVKTLGHYHEVGLIEPSEVDPGNGYRYYAEDDPGQRETEIGWPIFRSAA